MKGLGTAILAAIATSACAQAPDVTIKLDARLNYRSAPKDANTQRMYDSLGNYSLVSLSFKLEPGFNVLVSQKLQRFDGNRDKDLLDQYYIEDEGIWRLGKQYLPFGGGKLVRESAFAARGDTNLIIEGIPISAAAVQGEGGRQSGAVGRLGGRIGFSFFYGEHFGIDGTTLTLTRTPREALGKGRGYKRAFGLDFSKGIGEFNLAFDSVVFREPNSSLDDNFEAADVSATYTPSKYQTYFAGWTWRTNPSANYWRLGGSVFLTNGVYIEPMVRYRNGEVFDFNLAIRVRL